APARRRRRGRDRGRSRLRGHAGPGLPARSLHAAQHAGAVRVSVATHKGVASGEAERLRPAPRPTAGEILAALRSAPAGMRIAPFVGRYTDPGILWQEKGRGWDGCDCYG